MSQPTLWLAASHLFPSSRTSAVGNPEAVIVHPSVFRRKLGIEPGFPVSHPGQHPFCSGFPFVLPDHHPAYTRSRCCVAPILSCFPSWAIPRRPGK